MYSAAVVVVTIVALMSLIEWFDARCLAELARAGERELAIGASRQGSLQPPVELIGGQPPGSGRDLRLLDDLVPVLVRRPQLPARARLGSGAPMS